MMELTWLLCNRCFIHLTELKSPISMTQCGHLFCRKCICKVASQCPVCKANDVQSIVLTTPLQPMLRPIFGDLQTMAEQLLNAAKFQKCQLIVLEQHEQELAKKYMAIKAAYWQLVEQYKKVDAEYDAVKRDYDDYMIAQKNARVHSLFKEPPRNARVSFAQHNTIFGNNQQYSRKMFSPRSASNSEDSDASGSTIRAIRTPDGQFRVPTARRVPRSAGSAGTATSHSGASTPMSGDYTVSSGYGSDNNAYFRR